MKITWLRLRKAPTTVRTAAASPQQRVSWRRVPLQGSNRSYQRATGASGSSMMWVMGRAVWLKTSGALVPWGAVRWIPRESARSSLQVAVSSTVTLAGVFRCPHPCHRSPRHGRRPPAWADSSASAPHAPHPWRPVQPVGGPGGPLGRSAAATASAQLRQPPQPCSSAAQVGQRARTLSTHSSNRKPKAPAAASPAASTGPLSNSSVRPQRTQSRW